MTIKLFTIASGLLLSSQANAATLPHIYVRQDSSNGPTCSDKAQDSTFTYTSSGISYDVLCGKDYYGGDMRTTQAATFGLCLDQCNAESACLSVAFRDGTCYLKSTVTSAVSDSNVWSAKKSGAKSLSCDNKVDDGATYTASKGQFKIICGKEYYGGDLTSTLTPSFEACIEACAANSQCIDVSYVYGACYLKQSIGTLSSTDSAWTAQLISGGSTSPAPAKELSCLGNADDKKFYTTKSGGAYVVECGTDYAGGDLKTVESTTFQSCMDACDTTTGCIDVSWVTGSCYMKSSLNPAVALEHAWTGRKIDAPASSSMSSSSSPSPSSLAPSQLTPSMVSTFSSTPTIATPLDTPSSSVHLEISTSTVSSSSSSPISSTEVTSTTSSASFSTLTSTAASSSAVLSSSLISSTPSATPTGPSACLSSSTFKLGFINANKNTYYGRSKSWTIIESGLPGLNPIFTVVKATDTSATSYTFNDAGRLAVADIPNAALAAPVIPFTVTSMAVTSVAWFATPDQLAAQKKSRAGAVYANCVRDRTQTPNKLICSHPSMGTSRIIRCGGWMYFYPENTAAFPSSGCNDITMIVEDEVCT